MARAETDVRAVKEEDDMRAKEHRCGAEEENVMQVEIDIVEIASSDPEKNCGLDDRPREG